MAIRLIDTYRVIVTTGTAKANAEDQAEADRYQNTEVAKAIIDTMEESAYVGYDGKGNWHAYPLASVLNEPPNRSRTPLSRDAKVGICYFVAMLLILLGFCLIGGK
jgi:hypothetical protein